MDGSTGFCQAVQNLFFGAAQRAVLAGAFVTTPSC
jgi:hypothetical protein